MITTFHGDSRGPVRNDFTPTGRLRAEQQTVADSIAALAAQAAEGNAEGAEALGALARRKRNIDAQLGEVEAQELHEQNIAVQQRLARLPAAIADARAAREKFVNLFRNAAIALGDFARLSGEMGELLNLESRNNALNYAPHRAEVLEASKLPSPLEGLNYSPVMHVGFDWKYTLSPINAKIEEDQNGNQR